MTAPSKFVHIVYRTNRFGEMIDWYTRVFEARVRYRDDLIFIDGQPESTGSAFVKRDWPG